MFLWFSKIYFHSGECFYEFIKFTSILENVSRFSKIWGLAAFKSSVVGIFNTIHGINTTGMNYDSFFYSWKLLSYTHLSQEQFL